MRIVIVSLICLLATLAVWYWFYYFSIETTLEDYNSRFDKLANVIDDKNWLEATVQVDELNQSWEKTKRIWEYFVHQDDLDGISASIKKMKRAIENENTVLALMEIEDLKIDFERIKGNESLTLENIF